MRSQCSVLFAVILGAGCARIPLYADPTVRQRDRGPPTRLFSVDWDLRLVDDKFLEYLPREYAPPTADSASVVALTRDGVVRSVDLNGRLRWSYRTAVPFSAPARIVDRVVYVPGGDGHLYAFNQGTGALLWSYAAGEELVTAPVVVDGKVLVASIANTLFAVDASSGKWVWQYKRDIPSGFTIRGAASPTVANGLAYIGFSDGYVVAVATDDGVAKWERALSPSGGQFVDADATPVLDERGQLYVASYRDGVYALDPKSGDVLWHTVISGVTSLLSRGDMVFYVGDQQVGALISSTGKTLWLMKLPAKDGRPPIFAHGKLVLPTTDALLFIDPITGRSQLAWNPGRGISATPHVFGSRMYVLSNMGYLYALRIEGGAG